MPPHTFEASLTAFILVRTTRSWLDLTPRQRFEVLRTEIRPAIEAKGVAVRSRFYDTEFYSARVSDIWVWEAPDHNSFQQVIEALRETRFWDDYFEVVDVLVGVENAYAINYGQDAIATLGA
ncbi:darcynin [Streptomyces griseorubiginosus]|uniref:Darcynin n=2 Tax=Streptomyces griseorubiginosus TaxID=67304 RepID=A0A124HVU5_9ACTN|nr:darcynin [Streptomyces griseorubiginosus]